MLDLGLKERVGVKFKEGICAELCLKLWFESGWYFWKSRVRMVLKAIVQRESPKQLLPKATSEAALRCFCNFI